MGTKSWLGVTVTVLVLALGTACGAPAGEASTAATGEPVVAHTAVPAATAQFAATSMAAASFPELANSTRTRQGSRSCSSEARVEGWRQIASTSFSIFASSFRGTGSVGTS